MAIQRYSIDLSSPAGRTAWLERRRHFLGASEIAAAAGLDPYKTSLDLFLEKSGVVSPQSENPAMRRGRLMESTILGYLQEELPWRFIRPNVFLGDPETQLGATPDALSEDPETGELVNVQLKTVSRSRFEQWDNQAPIGYQLQVAQENLLLGAGYGLLAVLVMTSYDAELQLFTVLRNPEAEARIREIATDFWRRIAEGRAPPADYTKDGEALAIMFPPSPDVPAPIDFGSDNRLHEILGRRAELKTGIKAAEAEAKALDNEIIAKLQGAESAICGDWKITRKMVHVAEKVVKAYDYPNLRVTRTKEPA
jgi:putative phage-type endonuclease